MNTGHHSLACSQCHMPSPGSVRQQLQGKMQSLVGKGFFVDFGAGPVTRDTCLSCHRRPKDRHPVFRFLEPRFAEARSTIGAHQCVGCHQEHLGRRVTVSLTFCQTCHNELQLAEDPILPTHENLIQNSRWASCLGCHDFHGNHEFETPSTPFSEAALKAYFSGGPSPYGAVLVPAKTGAP